MDPGRLERVARDVTASELDPLARAVLLAFVANPRALVVLCELLAETAAGAEGQEALDGAPAYTVDSLAAALDVTPRVVRNAITRGELEAVKRGARWIIGADAVAAWSRPAPGERRARPAPPRARRRPARRPLRDALRSVAS